MIPPTGMTAEVIVAPPPTSSVWSNTWDLGGLIDSAVIQVINVDAWVAQSVKQQERHPGVLLLPDDNPSLPWPSAIAKARDLAAVQTWLAISSQHQQCWPISRILALGFQEAQAYSSCTLFHHAIHSYKATPSWLNANSWANPEEWNKRRW